MGDDAELVAVLPAILREIAEDCGIAAAISLVRWRGGRHIYIPVSAGDDHPLVQHIGRQAADWLTARYAGDYLQIPKAGRYMQAIRDAEIRRRHDLDGLSAGELATEYHLHIRQIWRILSSDRDTAEDRQQPLL